MGRKKSLNPRRVLAPGGKRERVWIGGCYHLLPGPPGSPAANAEYARILAVTANGHRVMDGRAEPLVLELIQNWQNSSYGPQDQRERLRVKLAKKLFAKLYLEATIDEFSAKDLLDWQDWLCNLKRKDGKSRYNRESVKKFVGVVRKAFSWGVVHGRVKEIQVQSFERVPGPIRGQVRHEGRRQSVSDAVAEATFQFISPIVADLLRLIRLTGARPHEIYAIRPVDVIRHGELVLPLSGQVVDLDAIGCWGYLPPNKVAWAEKDRVVIFDAAAQRILQPYLDRNHLAHCFSPRESADAARARQTAKLGKCIKVGNKKPKSKQNVRRPGECYTSWGVCQAIERAAKKAGVPKWTPYQLRHRALQAIRREFGLEIATAAAGHANAATTEKRYAPPVPESAQLARAGKQAKTASV